ncbi:hypothetical protein M9458_055839 [Cirrhinus mrigala]|uniref:Uncharacterized protein n=1 Tax=Cirrhinus mrigala TaxID=683832 RepID=A0ABD0MIP8_CIRMR
MKSEQLAYISSLTRSVVQAQGSGALAPQPSGALGQLGEEQALPFAEHLFSRCGVGFGQHDSASHKQAHAVRAELPGVIQGQDSGPSKTFSEAPGAYGSSYAAWLVTYETASALAARLDLEMGMVPWHIPGQHYPGLLLPIQLLTTLLIMLTYIKRVGDLQTFSVNESYLEFGLADSHMTLRPWPSYVPKVLTTPFRDQVVNLQALPPEESDLAFALPCFV